MTQNKKERIVIGSINTDQKLELIRTIRAQNQYNRNLCRERERFLYGHEPVMERRNELYGAEAYAGTLQSKNERTYPEKEGRMFTGFRIRFFIAAILFVIVIFMDRNGTELAGKSMRELSEYLTESIIH